MLPVPVVPPRRRKVLRDFFILNCNCNGHNTHNFTVQPLQKAASKPLTQFLHDKGCI